MGCQIATAVLDRDKVGDLAQLLEQRRRHFDTNGLWHVVADDRQASFRHAGVEVDDALVVGGAFEEWRQHHDAVGAAVLGVAGALDHLFDQQGRSLRDDAGAAVDDLGTEGHQLLGFILAQVNVHPGSGAEYEAMHTCRDIAFDQAFETCVVDLALCIERGGDGQVYAGKLECRHLVTPYCFQLDGPAKALSVLRLYAKG
ncbi:hypothetical protein D9M71_533220 [compost metagenome]